MSVIVKSKESLLTTSSGYTNYRGILNLVIILLVLSNARAALENIIKYGILVDPLSWLLFLNERSKHWPALLIVLSQTFHCIVALSLEKLIARVWSISGRQQQQHGESKLNRQQQASRAAELFLLHGAKAIILINLFACISLPPIAIYTQRDTHPISTSLALMTVSIVFLKLVSYHMMNFWARDSQRAEKLQARTTKSFLRSYTPPAVEFNAISSLEAQSGTSLPEKGKPLANGEPIRAAATNSPNKNGPELRKRLNNSPVNNTIANSKSSSSNNNNNNNNNTAINNNTGGDSQAKPSEHGKPISPRGARLSSDQTKALALKALSKYPSNVSFQNMCAYIAFPTLCYELQYARTERIRKRFLIKRLVELVILSQLDMALIQQWIIPTVRHSVTPFRQMQFSHMLERLLKLAIPNHVIWLIWFYLFFHSLLNIIAELTRFADREFYRDWWNSESVYYFWSNWNIPVHKWCARHLYVPLIALGLTKCQASTAVFCVSAFFHEYLVSVPLKMFRMWAFTGMLIQLPWARFVSLYFNNHFANVAVWVSLIIGQPLCILMYYHDYYVINYVKSLPSR